MVDISEVNRMRWAARRGILELDLLLGPFVNHHFVTLNEADRATFERLMTCQDQDLYAYLMRREAPDDPSFKPMIDKIRAATGAPQG